MDPDAAAAFAFISMGYLHVAPRWMDTPQTVALHRGQDSELA